MNLAGRREQDKDSSRAIGSTVPPGRVRSKTFELCHQFKV